ncbi:hypothetical protein [Blastopirellula marina]|uniref:Uncharacterized protein n=1 Tax=Blastopirellula marina TaxID=124 RepID=A0A2S8FSN3_9BACT|nr:hypothetical protein [Blastopirellula marina]PQO35191.1 hypothetical protein C5Y98_14675 [Blastopirellula marina]PQO47982.1 hypothetical protein C5Y93_00925 [Blastopirellula marina]PTL43940.1 hypothetical protein C5Y97_14685 [Blastopirellula marina]
MPFFQFLQSKRLPIGAALLNFAVAILILWIVTGHLYWRFPLSMSILLGGIIDITGQVRLRWRHEKRLHITLVEMATLSTCVVIFFAAANYDRKLQINNHRAGILGNIELLGGSYEYGETGLRIAIDNPNFSDDDLPKLCAYLAMASDAKIPIERLEIYRHAMTGRSRLLLLDMALPHEAHIEGLPEKWEREYRDAHSETLVEFVPAVEPETEERILTTADVIDAAEKEAPPADPTAL